ncbi:YopX family protein [Enterococcus faecalis]|nr:YopX family protein [Enterococcus faecalis]MDN3074975.1 YopX family protein [Enterococcus faecalis]
MIPKFRAYSVEENIMYYPDEDKNVEWTIDDDTGFIAPLINLENGMWGMIDKYILMQSTGFKDDNGVEIFEGDVVNIHWFYTDYDPETLGAIENEATAEKVVITKEFGNLGFWWNSGDDWVDLTTLALTVQLHEESFELLGNIYENPDLLEVK